MGVGSDVAVNVGEAVGVAVLSGVEVGREVEVAGEGTDAGSVLIGTGECGAGVPPHADSSPDTTDSINTKRRTSTLPPMDSTRWRLSPVGLDRKVQLERSGLWHAAKPHSRRASTTEPPDVGGHPAVHVGRGSAVCAGGTQGRQRKTPRTNPCTYTGGISGPVNLNCSTKKVGITLKANEGKAFG